MLKYHCKDPKIVVAICDRALDHLRTHRQTRSTDPEAGGQLFGMLEPNRFVIQEATGPRTSDRRTRYSYIPNRKAERQEIVAMFKKGLHYIGDWHTHPTTIPSPSTTDVANIGSCVRESVHELIGFILIIVGKAQFPDGLWVSIHTGNGEVLLEPIDQPGLNGGFVQQETKARNS